MLTLLFKEMMNKEKSYTLTPDWKYFFLAYLICVLTIPLIIGIVGFYFVRKHHKSLSYFITDTGITAQTSDYRQNIDLINIQTITIVQDWLREKLGVGSLIIQTTTTNVVLKGLEKPEEIKQLIEQAVEVLKKQAEETTRPKTREPEFDPGSMEKMNYLTGLWQQGLISDEDFEEERKHFE